MVAFKKDIFRVIRSNHLRFISLLLIIALGICFVTGVGGISKKVTNSFNDYYKENNVADIIIKSKKETGIDLSLTEILDRDTSIKSYEVLTQIDDSTNNRLYIYNFNSKTNILDLKSGRLPEKSSEVVLEYSNSSNYKIGDTITYYNTTFEIVGFVKNPLLLAKSGDLSQMTNNYLENIIYVSSDYNLFVFLPLSDIYITLNHNYDYFSKSYSNFIESTVHTLSNTFSNDNYSILTLNKNLSYAFLKNICEKIDVIALLFPLFFILVVALVTMTNMSRLIDEERKSIACLKSLGYSSKRIITKYLIFAFLATITGSLIGLVSGVFIIPNICYNAFGGVFYIPQETNKVTYLIGLITSIFMVIITIFVTYYEAQKSTSDIPANLFKAKMQKAGKQIWIEKTKLWNHIKFKYKSTIRNMFRFKSRFFMIVISLMLSTLLVMAGFGLYDISNTDIIINGIIVDSNETIKIISLAIIVFALLLSLLVLYNLTTLTIGEREREIATLKVLGYKTLEVNGFIYREIFVEAIIGIILGIPLGVFFLFLVFTMMDFGALTDIKVLSYFLTLGVSILFVIIVFLLTQSKIKKVDMNASLKSVD